jgi:single-strand DNA-binding protein
VSYVPPVGKVATTSSFLETDVTGWHRVFAWSNLSKFARTLQKGQLITLEGILRYREYEEEVHGLTVRHRVAEVHAISLKRLSKIEAADDPSDAAD